MRLSAVSVLGGLAGISGDFNLITYSLQILVLLRRCGLSGLSVGPWAVLLPDRSCLLRPAWCVVAVLPQRLTASLRLLLTSVELCEQIWVLADVVFHPTALHLVQLVDDQVSLLGESGRELSPLHLVEEFVILIVVVFLICFDALAEQVLVVVLLCPVELVEVGLLRLCQLLSQV